MQLLLLHDQHCPITAVSFWIHHKLVKTEKKEEPSSVIMVLNNHEPQLKVPQRKQETDPDAVTKTSKILTGSLHIFHI